MKNKDQIRALLGQNKLEAAIEALKSSTKGEYLNAVTQIEARLNELKRKINLGILSNQEQELERNKITQSLIEVLSGKLPATTEAAQPSATNNKTRILIFSLILLAVITFTLLTANQALPFSGSNGVSYLIYVLSGLLAAYTCYGILDSYSEIKGHKYGFNIRMGGPVVALLLVTFGGGYYEKNLQTSSDLDIRIVFVSGDQAGPQKLNGKLSLFLGNEEKYHILENQSSILFQGISNRYRGEALNIALESSKFAIDSLSLKQAKITDDGPITLKINFTRKYAKPHEVAFDLFFKEGTTVSYGPKANTKILSLVFDVHSHSDYIIPLDKKAELFMFSGCYKGLLELKRYDYTYLAPREFDELLFETEVSDDLAADLICSIGSFHLSYHPLIEKSDSTWQCSVIFTSENLQNF